MSQIQEQIDFNEKDPQTGPSIQVTWRDFGRRQLWILTLFYADRDGFYAQGNFAPGKPKIFSHVKTMMPFQMGSRGPVFTREGYAKLGQGNAQSIETMYDRALEILKQKKLLNPRRSRRR